LRRFPDAIEGGPRLARAALAISALVFLGATPAWAQVPDLPPEDRDSTPEAFPEVDPYTEGDDELLERLGYLGHGPFATAGPSTSLEIERVLGGVPILWVETEHFQLASTLRTYRLPGDKQENDKLAEELEQLEERLGRLKPPRNELDPWLRLHLYAQRLEELYADFCRTFGVDAEDFGPEVEGGGEGPYLGQREKFLVLVLQKSSSLGRFTRRFTGEEQDFAYRFGFTDGGYVFAVAAEALLDAGLDLDASLHCYVAWSVVTNFCDAYRKSWGRVPPWFKYGLSHRASREIDPRWALYEGAEVLNDLREDAWRWQPRVRGLVVNEVFPPWGEMLAWKDWSEMNQRAHMMAWSCVDWLLEREDARPAAFLAAVTDPLPEGVWQVAPEESLARQRAGLEAAFGSSVEDLDSAWRKHVKRRYERK